MTSQQAYKNAHELRQFCKKQKCETCIFRTGRRGNVMVGCRLGDEDIPEFWELRYAHMRLKEGEQE